MLGEPPNALLEQVLHTATPAIQIHTPPPSPMPLKDSSARTGNEHHSAAGAASRVQDIFSIPAPLKKLFDRVPVLIYPPNELPQRAPKPSRVPSLYVFSSERDSAAGRPSFNPSCLKWQVG